MEERIRRAIEESFAEAGAGPCVYTLERPGDPAHGDYTTNIAMIAFAHVRRGERQRIGLGAAEPLMVSVTHNRSQWGSPFELAAVLAGTIKQKLGADASAVDAVRPGFINITLSRAPISLALAEADARGAEWGRSAAQAGKRISIEYSNPNPFKEMHIGHLMSNVVGEAASRLIAATGAAVIRDTFGGDVGPHVAKALWGLRSMGMTAPENAKEIGAAYAAGSNAYEEDETAKREIDDLNVRLYAVVGNRMEAARSAEDQALLEAWRAGRECSMEEFRRLFALLGTRLDYEFFDSDTIEPGMRLVREGLAKGVFEESDGAIIYRGEKVGLHTLVFVTSRGTPTYETKDLGLALIREEKIAADEFFIVTGIEQVGHFKVFLAALAEVAPGIALKTRHLPHGLLRLTTGKMSSRKGNVITGADLIREMLEKASERNADPLVAEQVAIGAIKYMILRQAPGSDIVFDPEKSLSLDGDSGPYLQYALVRARSVLAAARPGGAGGAAPEHPHLLERLIVHYPEVVARATRELAPHLLVTYLIELAGAWNSLYAAERIIGGAHEAHRLLVARAFAASMANGLALLGIPAPAKM